MAKISMLVSQINALVDKYYREQRLMNDSDPEFANYYMHRMDRSLEHLLGIRDAINLLGYEAKFSDNMFPFSHVSDIVQTE